MPSYRDYGLWKRFEPDTRKRIADIAMIVFLALAVLGVAWFVYNVNGLNGRG